MVTLEKCLPTWADDSTTQKADGSAEVAASPSHGPTTPTQEKAMDIRSDTTATAGAASVAVTADRRRIVAAIDELIPARIESLMTLRLMEKEIARDPRDSGAFYPLSDEQVEMLMHAANLSFMSIQRAINALEAA